MKLILKTSAFIFLVLLMVFSGKLINALTFEKIRTNVLLEEAESKYQEFVETRDPGKNTVVVIGTSTSLFSFPDDSNVIQNSSYVELLNQQINTLNLSSTNLHYASEAKALVEFARDRLPDTHLVILENLNYVQPLNLFIQYVEVKSVAACLSMSATDPKFQKRECRKILKDYFAENFVWFKNPCLKKHKEDLKLAFKLESREITKRMLTVMKCNEGIFKSDDVPLELMDLFHFGHFKELKETFRLSGYKLNDFSEVAYTDTYSMGEAALINDFVKYLLEKNEDQRLLVIPTPARVGDRLKELPLFKNDNERVALIEVYEEINEMRTLRDLKFFDIYPDGSHSRAWVHELLANKILPNLSKSVRMDLDEQ